MDSVFLLGGDRLPKGRIRQAFRSPSAFVPVQQDRDLLSWDCCCTLDDGCTYGESLGNILALYLG